MRHAALAAALLVFSLYVCPQNAQAHGPGGAGHASAGPAKNAGHSAAGQDFRGGGFMGVPSGNGQLQHKLNSNSANGPGNNFKPNLAGLHPNSLTGTNGSTSSSSSTAASGATSGSTQTNLSGNGSTPLSGEIAKIHHLEEQLRKLKREEALQLLQQAKQSGNPQQIAKAEQVLQHIQQNRSQQGGNGNATAPSGQNTVKPTPVMGGNQSPSHAHISHGSPGSNPAGHAHR